MRIPIPFVILSLCATNAGADEPKVKGLAAHEWGVFTAHDDVDVANADVRAEWDSMPDFVYGRIKGRVVPVNWGPVEIRKRPVIWFHSERAADLKVRVSFPGGKPGLWWPGTKVPATRGQEQPPPTDYLEWRVGVRNAPAGFQARESPAPLAPGHWIDTLRAVRAEDVFAVYGEQSFDCDREKFLYYDGLFPQGEWVKVAVEKDNVTLTNRTKHAVFDVTVVDRRTAGKVRVGRIAKLDAGADVKAVEMAAADAGRFSAAACETLQGQLTAAGLNADEAAALVTFRKADFFGTAGVQVFYRIPQEEYDRLLPLDIQPKPEKTVRVGLVFHPHCEPDLAEQVAAVVKALDDDDFAAREAALKKLADLGPAAFVHLERLKKTKLSPEVRSRIELVLEKWDARRAFPEK